jgi:hypothetical protein
MNTIKIDCDCGTTIDTGIESDYDVMIHGEKTFKKEITCSKCKTKYVVKLEVLIL